MTDFTILLAGTAIRVEALHASTLAFCRDYLTDAAPEFSVRISQEDIACERARSVREEELEGQPAGSYSDRYLETLALYRKITGLLLQKGVVLFHGSVVAAAGKAYLFTAFSGIGKTTHTGLWLRMIPGAYILNGDKPLLRVTEDRVYACGTPWQGKERYGRNETLPLEAICLLERSETNRIERISFHDALSTLIQQVNRPEAAEPLLQTLQLIGAMENKLRFYRLHCNQDDEAALVSYRGMTEEQA